MKFLWNNIFHLAECVLYEWKWRARACLWGGKRVRQRMRLTSRSLNWNYVWRFIFTGKVIYYHINSIFEKHSFHVYDILLSFFSWIYVLFFVRFLQYPRNYIQLCVCKFLYVLLGFRILYYSCCFFFSILSAFVL